MANAGSQIKDTSTSENAGAKVLRWLRAIDEDGVLPAEAEGAVSLIHQIYVAWVDQGGFVAGKVRNSVRQLVDILGNEHEVKSIRPKLNGLTRLTRKDTESLLKAFLQNWEFHEQASEIRSKGYSALGSIDIDKVTKTILDSAYPSGSFEARRGILLPDSRGHQDPADEVSRPKEDETTLARNLIPELFRQSQTLITVSQQRTIIGRRSAGETIQGFASTIDTLWQVDENDALPEQANHRVLAWVLDVGNRDSDLEDSYRSFFNLDFLACQFRAIRIIDDSEGDQRWEWLDKHAIFLVGKLTHDEIDRLYGEACKADLSKIRAKWQNIDANHISLGALPSAWVSLQQLRDLYGRHLERFDDRTFTIFTGGSDTSPAHAEPVFFGYASESDGTAFGRQLPSPGENYSQAVRIVDMAARYRLGVDDERQSQNDKLTALVRLRQIGFAVLRLGEFLNISKNLME